MSGGPAPSIGITCRPCKFGLTPCHYEKSRLSLKDGSIVCECEHPAQEAMLKKIGYRINDFTAQNNDILPIVRNFTVAAGLQEEKQVREDVSRILEEELEGDKLSQAQRVLDAVREDVSRILEKELEGDKLSQAQRVLDAVCAVYKKLRSENEARTSSQSNESEQPVHGCKRPQDEPDKAEERSDEVGATYEILTRDDKRVPIAYVPIGSFGDAVQYFLSHPNGVPHYQFYLPDMNNPGEVQELESALLSGDRYALYAAIKRFKGSQYSPKDVETHLHKVINEADSPEDRKKKLRNDVAHCIKKTTPWSCVLVPLSDARKRPRSEGTQ